MSVVVVERSFTAPVALEDIEAVAQRGAWCLEAHAVSHLKSYFSRDRRRMVCLYEAPDAESVRLAQEKAGLPFERAWAARVIRHTADEPEGNTVVLERILPRPVDEAVIRDAVVPGGVVPRAARLPDRVELPLGRRPPLPLRVRGARRRVGPSGAEAERDALRDGLAGHAPRATRRPLRPPARTRGLSDLRGRPTFHGSSHARSHASSVSSLRDPVTKRRTGREERRSCRQSRRSRNAAPATASTPRRCSPRSTPSRASRTSRSSVSACRTAGSRAPTAAAGWSPSRARAASTSTSASASTTPTTPWRSWERTRARRQSSSCSTDSRRASPRASPTSRPRAA